MAVVALIGWVLNSLLGLYMLKARRQRLALFHLAVMLTGLGLWIGFVAADVVALAWIAWAVLNVGNGLGDTLLTRGWRRRNPGAPGNAYWQAAKEATFTTRRPLPLAHGFLAGGTYFTALAAALISS
ncbi:hypothetical protein ACSHWB_42750 [Lentzea sp. HUAS TT2]|uniref:hypothetical protein n=1 Tax=Lentzea sp. HUAS TT2 TaxID=3447454 RepID=UPI003F71E40F